MKIDKKYILGLVILIGVGIIVYRVSTQNKTSSSNYSISIDKGQQESAKKLAKKKEITEAELVAQYIGENTEKENPQPITNDIVSAIESLTLDNMMDVANNKFLGNSDGLSDVLVMMKQNARVDTGYIKTLKNSDGTVNIAIPYLISGKIAGVVLVRYMPNAKAYSMLIVVTPDQVKSLQEE